MDVILLRVTLENFHLLDLGPLLDCSDHNFSSLSVQFLAPILWNPDHMVLT